MRKMIVIGALMIACLGVGYVLRSEREGAADIAVGASGSGPVSVESGSPQAEIASSAGLDRGVRHLTVDNFDKTIRDSGKLVLVDFWAPWCGPCLQMSPTIDALARDLDGKAIVGKLNIDDADPIRRGLEIDSIPTLIIFKDGRELKRMVGVHSKEELRRALARFGLS